jgi:hypothetical protein
MWGGQPFFFAETPPPPKYNFLPRIMWMSEILLQSKLSVKT